ncbi:MarR family winged helix-turn-helix transcriptional regulator [Georgenia faecalis]|uniref:MarR family winged helix-turn-helix transcriptional regulator n=1 Tax=Georgenia faecalis TaxID=2483799 RepID=A0ABV9D6N4_9MICO|nr:MarR family transcriptional regulator [Georgenia faecalis]
MPTLSPAPAVPPASRKGRPDLATELRMTILRLSRRIRSESSAADVSESQYCVLSGLSAQGAMTPRALAERDGVQPPSMTRTIAGLEQAGLVARNDHPSDGRQVLIELTPAGAEVVRETRRRRSAWVSRRLAALSPEDRAVLSRAVDILKEMASQ